jgi:hypothetical protein
MAGRPMKQAVIAPSMLALLYPLDEQLPGYPRQDVEEDLVGALVRASNFIPGERLGSTDDCGFSPFSIDEKPNHGSPDYARDVAFQKITNRVQGTRLAAEALGVS